MCTTTLQGVARAVCTWLKGSTAVQAPVHDEALLLLESMLRRGLVQSGAVFGSNVMQWLPLQTPVLSNAALRCVAAVFMQGTRLRLACCCQVACKSLHAVLAY